ncbi:MAG: extracellular solute-binding protein [Prolixibacteraceae bacterium]|nr:extracellular solute-binding protein [Prolixibacteraceae bacterium]
MAFSKIISSIEKNLFQKKYVLVFLLPIAYLLSSCSENNQGEINAGSKSFTSSQKQAKEITWMAPWYDEGNKELMMRDVRRHYEFLNQDIKLRQLFTNELYPDELWWAAVSPDIIRMIENDDWPYDVLICEKGHYRVIANQLNDPDWSKKYFVDFKEEDWFIDAHREGILDSKSILSTYGGIIPGPLLEGTIYILYVSTVVEEKLGIQVKRLNMDFTDFLEYARVVYKYNQTHSDKIGFFSTQDGSAVSRLFKHLTLTAYGKEEFSSNAESYEALAKVYAAFEELSKFNPLERYVDYGDMNTDALQRILNEEDYLFNMEATWIYNIWESSNPEGLKKMKPCELPSFEGKSPTHYEGDFQTIFAVPKRGKNVEEAKKLIRYLSSGDIGEQWINITKCPTGLKTRISFTDFGKEEFDVFFRHLQGKYGTNFSETNLYILLWGKSPDYTYEEPSFNADFMHQDILNGKISAKRALERVKQKYR